jgi:hypothetical protein
VKLSKIARIYVSLLHNKIHWKVINEVLKHKIPFYQQMHFLLNTQNVKIYIKMSHIRSYMFRSTGTILRELILSLAKVTLL